MSHKYLVVPNDSSLDLKAFSFDTYEEYQEGIAKHNLSKFQIKAVELNTAETLLFNALEIDKDTLETWIDELDDVDLSNEELAAIYYLCKYDSWDFNDAAVCYDDLILFTGTLLEYATEYADECVLPCLPETAQKYFDYAKLANDLKCGGDAYEFVFDGETYTADCNSI